MPGMIPAQYAAAMKAAYEKAAAAKAAATKPPLPAPNPATPAPATAPKTMAQAWDLNKILGAGKEGDTKTFYNVPMVYSGGKWIRKTTAPAATAPPPQPTPDEQQLIPKAPDVGQPFMQTEIPAVDTQKISDAFSGMGTAIQNIQAPDVSSYFKNIQAPEDVSGKLAGYYDEAKNAGEDIAAPDYQDIYGQVEAPENLGGQMAGYYDDIKYQEDTENINRLYDDMMKQYNWDETKQEVLREGAIGARAATGLNAGPGLGGSFISAMGQADINAQGALMAQKMDFLNRLTDIQQQRAQALATEHQLGQKYGIEIGELQAGIKSEEDKAIRDAEYQLSVQAAGQEAETAGQRYGQLLTGAQQAAQQKAGALAERAVSVANAKYDLGLKVAGAQADMAVTKYQAMVQAVANGEIAKAQTIADELSKQSDRTAAQLMSAAEARSNMMAQEWQFTSQMAKEAAMAEPSLTDASTGMGTNVMVDPKTGVGVIKGVKDPATGKDYTVSATAVTTIQQAQLQMKMSEGVADVRESVTMWAAKHPAATKQQILNEAGRQTKAALIKMMVDRDTRTNRDGHLQKKGEDLARWERDRAKQIEDWANHHMAAAYGENWQTGFTGIMKDEKYRPKAPREATVVSTSA